MGTINILLVTDLEKELNIVDILELDKLERNDVPFKLLLCNIHILSGLHAGSFIKVQRIGLVHEDSQSFGTLIRWTLHFEAVYLDILVEGDGEDELLVAVAH